MTNFKPIWQCLFFIGALFISGLSLSEELVFKGFIGKYPILMELNISDNDVTGRYAYHNRLIAIHLEGKGLHHLTEFKLPPRLDNWEEAEAYELEASATFSGELINERYQGEWMQVGRKMGLAFNLVQIKPSQRDEESESIFDSLIRQQMSFNPIAKSMVHSDNHILVTQNYIEPITRNTLPRFITMGDDDAKVKINEFLEEEHARDVQTSLWCLAEGYTDPSDSVGHKLEDSQLIVEYYAPPLLELSFSGSFYCGGAHPSNVYSVINIDTESGEELELTSLFAIYKDESESTALSDEFKSILLKHIDKGYQCLEEMSMDEFDLAYIEFHITKENYVAVKFASLGHALFACELDDIANIPVTELKQFALPEAAKYFSDLN